MVGDYELAVAKMAEQLPVDVVRVQGRRRRGESKVENVHWGYGTL